PPGTITPARPLQVGPANDSFVMVGATTTFFCNGCATHHTRSWSAGGPEKSRAVHRPVTGHQEQRPSGGAGCWWLTRCGDGGQQTDIGKHLIPCGHSAASVRPLVAEVRGRGSVRPGAACREGCGS